MRNNIKISIIFLIFCLLLSGCGKKETLTDETKKEVTTQKQTQIQTQTETAEALVRDKNFLPMNDSIYTIKINGVKITLPCTVREILDKLNSVSFYYIEDSVINPGEITGVGVQLNPNPGPTEKNMILGISAINSKTQNSSVYDCMVFRIETTIFNSFDTNIEMGSDIKYGSTVDEIINVYGNPTYTTKVTNQNILTNVGGYNNNWYCGDGGIPISEEEKGTYMRFSYGVNTFIETVNFDNTGLMEYIVNLDLGQKWLNNYQSY